MLAPAALNQVGEQRPVRVGRGRGTGEVIEQRAPQQRHRPVVVGKQPERPRLACEEVLGALRSLAGKVERAADDVRPRSGLGPDERLQELSAGTSPSSRKTIQGDTAARRPASRAASTEACSERTNPDTPSSPARGSTAGPARASTTRNSS